MADIALTASIGRVEATFSTSYKDVVFASSYKNICIVAEATFPDVFSVEVVNPIDAIALATTKTASDVMPASVDLLIKQATKSLADLIYTLDDPNISFNYGANEGDVQDVLEHLTYSVNRLLSPESLYLIDNMDGDIEYALIKVIGELQLLNDFAVTNFGKNPNDSIATSDVISAYIVVIREFAESLSAPDIFLFDMQKSLSDVAMATDNRAYAIDKPLLDELSNVDARSTLFNKLVLGAESNYTLPYPEPAYFAETYTENTVGEILFATDYFTSERIYGKTGIDMVNLGDAGVLSMQDYVSLGYLSEDYVGVGRTF